MAYFRVLTFPHSHRLLLLHPQVELVNPKGAGTSIYKCPWYQLHCHVIVPNKNASKPYILLCVNDSELYIKCIIPYNVYFSHLNNFAHRFNNIVVHFHHQFPKYSINCI